MLTPHFRDVITSRRQILAGALVLAIGPGVALAQTAPSKPLEVVTSFSILADLTRQVAKERANVVPLVGPNADAHVYQASPADARKVKDAGLIVVNGLGFETFMPRLIRSAGAKAPVVTATAGIKPIKAETGHGHGHSHGAGDPHAWQSIEAVRTYVANIRDGLIKADPAGEAAYRRNAEAYLAELATLKGELETSFAALPKDRRVAVTSHDALAYFAREFGFTLEAVQGVSTEAEPSAKDVARIIRLTREKKARAIFVENMNSPRIAEQIARETGAKIGGTLFSDALSDEKGPAPTYIAMMRHNAKVLLEALKAE
ncbi:MAG: zinc ABC transporter substrate-binding protein [Beijerinckiaceae bacterium]|nr:zinc ABC transporter substrate-binding protein [Beijerinckiaceae bacterium]MCZ8300953.1 zinc ABC transporter substrate-binding protein [Beijerinckiaceae bacterium]